MLNQSLLIVDDEPNTISSLKRQLRHKNYSIYSANSAKAGLEFLKKNDIGVVISDLMMPGIDGITFLQIVKQIKPNVVRILITGYGTLENAMDGINRSRVFGYLTKPWSSEIISGTIEGAFQHYNLRIENQRLQKLTEEQNKQLNIVSKNPRPKDGALVCP